MVLEVCVLFQELFAPLSIRLVVFPAADTCHLHVNFKIVGFTSEPTLAELATLAHEHGLPLLYDQGSGACSR